MDALEGLSQRGYTEGFYRRHVPQKYQSYEDRNTTGIKQQVVGEFLEYDASRGRLTIDVKNQFSVGDHLEVMLPTGNQTFFLEAMEDKSGQSILRAPGSGHIVHISVHLMDSSQLNYGYLIRHWL